MNGGEERRYGFALRSVAQKSVSDSGNRNAHALDCILVNTVPPRHKHRRPMEDSATPPHHQTDSRSPKVATPSDKLKTAEELTLVARLPSLN
ncbi:hypothetical protein MTP99_016086 [Tenebrio molitor]|jgi:hypothetical protein|nr:hypothetical protein MTP99_016086 [Tenebrio molitor]